MRVTVTIDECRGAVRIDAESARDYPPGQLGRIVAAATARLLDQPGAHRPAPIATGTAADPAGNGETGQPARRRGAHDQPQPTAPDHGLCLEADWGGRRADVVRGRVLRALDRGATVAQAAARFGIDPALVDCWDDDAARDGRTDLLAASPGDRWWSR